MMKWYSWIFREKRVARRLKIPAKDVRNICKKIDFFRQDQTCVAHYDLWQYIESLLPDTREGNWNYVQSGTDITLVEKL